MTNIDYDIIIVGGGLVGLAFALSLQDTDLSIAVIDAKPYKPLDTTQSRPLSLNDTSYRVLKNLNLWKDVEKNATPIKHVHISERNQFGALRLRAEEVGAEALGYVINIIDLFAALQTKTLSQKNLTFIQPATVNDISFQAKTAALSIDTESGAQHISGALIIAADGSHSQLVERLHLNKEQRDYNETAITAILSLSQHHDFTAYERFTKEGTIALLPLTHNTCGLVWSVCTDKTENLLSLSDGEFIDKLHENIGYRAGHFEKISKRHSHPLTYSYVSERVKNNVVILGNASQTIHPIAAQGFNLGLIDAVTLSDKIKPHSNIHMLQAELLKQFEADCAEHQKNVIRFTNGTVNVFQSHNPAVMHGRSLALNLLGLCSKSRQLVAKFGMGKLRKCTKSACTVA